MIDEKLTSLNISLPLAPKPAGSYVPVTITNNLAFVSGQIPIKDGKVQFQGKVPSTISIDDAQKAAKLCIINVLAQLKAEIGTLDRVSRIVRVSGYVNSSDDFAEQPKIINAASDLLVEIFGDKGRHSRTAVGVACLPFNSSVEIDAIIEIT